MPSNIGSDPAALKLFRSAEESEKPERAAIKGSLPSWLEGSFLRIGPGKFEFNEEFALRHWLDGYALLQKFEIKKDSVLFEKRYLQSDAYKKGMAAQRPVINEFGTPAQKDPNKGFFARIVSNLLPEFTDNNYATLFHISSDIFVSCDTCFFRRVDGSTLESHEKWDGNKVFGLNGQTAHPLLDEETGDIYNLGFNLLPTAKYSFTKIPHGKDSKDMLKNAKTVVTFPSRWSGAISINHSFGMTANYLICIEQPLKVSVGNVVSSLVKGATLKDIMEWHPEEKNRFVLVHKSTGKILKTDFLSEDPFYFMHIINCFEEENQIVLDLVAYASPNMLDSLFMDKLRNDEDGDVDLAGIRRFVIPLLSDVKTAKEGESLIKGHPKCTAVRKGNKIVLGSWNITDGGLEMPMINHDRRGKPYRYTYLAGTFNKSPYSHTITKTDLQSGTTMTYKSDFMYPSEPYFIQNPKNRGDEDDGVIISALTDARSGHEDYLVFLDAKNMKEIGRAAFKSHVPSALHGLFLPK